MILIGEYIKNKMRIKGYTQKALAKKLHVSSPTLNKYLLNKRQFPIDILVDTAKELDFSLDELFDISPNNKTNNCEEIYEDIVHKLKAIEKETGNQKMANELNLFLDTILQSIKGAYDSDERKTEN